MNHADFCELFNVYETTVRNLLQFPSRHTQEQKDMARLAIIREWEAAQSSPATPSAENRGICSACNGSGFADATGLHACFRCNGDGAENRPAQDDVRIAALKEARHIVYMAESLDHAFARIDAAIASQSAKEPKK